MARRKKRSRQPKPQKGPNTGYLFLAAILLGGIVYVLADADGIWYELLGTALWLSALFLTMALLLLNYARFLLPLDDEQGWYEGGRLLAFYFVYCLPAGLQDLFAGPVGFTQYPDPPVDVPPSFKTLGAGVIESHLILALSRGSAYSRAAGPGYVHLGRGERIRHVFDLRPHQRATSVKAMTRDGIPIDVTVSIRFRIRETDQYNAIFLLSYTGSRGDDMGEIVWTERMAPLAAASLVTQLSHKTLDQLYPLEGTAQPLADMTEAIKRDVDLQLSKIFDYSTSTDGPIEIMNVEIGQMRAPRDVLRQRVRNWQLTWERYIFKEQSEGSAEALRRINVARARAQMELLQNIVENIETMRQAGHSNLSEVVRLRMLEAMETALSDGGVQAFLPQQVLTALDDVQSLVETPQLPGPGDTSAEEQPTI